MAVDGRGLARLSYNRWALIAPFHYEVRAPRPPLDRCVLHLWYARGTIDYGREAILPAATPVLIINFGAPHRTIAPIDGDPDAPGRGRETLLRDAWLCGQHTRPIVNAPVAETHMVGVTFRPDGAFPFLERPVGELTDRVVALDDVWGPLAGELRERLLALAGGPARLDLLEAVLTARLRAAAPPPRRIDRALSLLTREGGALPVADVCATLGVSPRHLTGEFHRLVGLSPKTFSRIVRFRRALTRAATRAPVDWAALAATCEYYDQAHFNRDFRRFSGVTPTAYQRQRAAVFGAMAEEAEQFLPLPPA